MLKRSRLLLALFLVLALVAAACGSDDESTDTTDTTAAPTTEAPADDETTTEAPADEETTTTTTEAPADEETTTTTEAVVRAEGDLVIWGDDKRAPALRPFAEQFGEANGISVVVQEIVPFEDIDDRVIIAGPAGEGPDIFVGPMTSSAAS